MPPPVPPPVPPAGDENIPQGVNNSDFQPANDPLGKKGGVNRLGEDALIRVVLNIYLLHFRGGSHEPSDDLEERVLDM